MEQARGSTHGVVLNTSGEFNSEQVWYTSVIPTESALSQMVYSLGDIGSLNTSELMNGAPVIFINSSKYYDNT